MLGEKVRRLAELCGGREIDLIASGYNPQVLPYCWLALISGLAEFPLKIEEPEPVPPHFLTDGSISLTREVIADVKRYHKEYWKSLG